jgi:hypothetical protein
MDQRVSKLIDNRESLSEEEIRSLAEHMASDPAFAEEVIGLLETDNLLSVTACLDRQDFVAQVHQKIRDLNAGLSVKPPVVQASSSRLHVRWWRRAMALAASVLVLLGVSVGVYNRNQPVIAELTSVSGDVFVTSDTKTIKGAPGMWLLSGAQVVVGGPGNTTVVAWKDGSSMRLDGISRLTILSVDGQKRCFLSHGVLNAEIKKQQKGKPLIIDAPYSQITVRGTTLRLSSDGKSTELLVVEGLVSMKRLSDGKSVDVTASHSAKVTSDDSFALVAQRVYWVDRFSGKPGRGKPNDVMFYKRLELDRFKGK